MSKDEVKDPALMTAEEQESEAKKGSKPSKAVDMNDIAQFNYRVPGEVETYMPTSKDQPGGDPKKVAKDAEAESDRLHAANKVEEGKVSPNHGMSDPKSQLDTDRENAWSTARD